jgi:hypothetical protein
MAVRRYGRTMDQAIAEITKFHAIGSRSLEEFPDRLPHGDAKKAGTHAGMSSERLRKARAFARGFSKRELIRLRREIELGGIPVGVQHMVRLLRLPANRRWKFLRDTIDQKWSCKQLATAIRQTTGRRRAGRAPMVRDRSEAIQHLVAICEQWKRLHDVISGTRTGAGNGEATVLLRPRLDDTIQKCDEAMQRLYRALRRFRNV